VRTRARGMWVRSLGNAKYKHKACEMKEKVLRINLWWFVWLILINV
jgi:hypothetical protein